MTKYSAGDIVEIIGASWGNRLSRWAGLQCKIIRVDKTSSCTFTEGYLEPLSPRPDSSGMSRFYWALDDIKLISKAEYPGLAQGEEEPVTSRVVILIVLDHEGPFDDNCIAEDLLAKAALSLTDGGTASCEVSVY